MHILHLTSEYPPAQIFGLGRYVSELAEVQASRGHDVEIITNSLNGNDKEFIKNRVRVMRVRTPSPPKAPVTSAMLLHFNLQIVERFVENWINDGSHPFDVICSHDWLTVTAGYHIGRLTKCPLVTTIHDVIFNKVKHRKFSSEDDFIAGIENWACHVSNHLIVLSNYVREELIEHYHALPEAISIIASGTDIHPFEIDAYEGVASWRKKILPDHELLILYAGRLDPEKGIFVLLEAVSAFNRTHPNGWRVGLAGRGHLQTEIEDRILSLNLSDKVTLLGYLEQSELRNAYGAADILVVPSLYEPFGLVALEGQQVGTPIIVSDTGGLREILSVTKGGRSFPVGNSEALCQELSSLISNSALRTQLGLIGKDNSLAHFNWIAIEKKICNTYQLAQEAPFRWSCAVPEWKWGNRVTIHDNMSALTATGCANQSNAFELSNIVVFWRRDHLSDIKDILLRLAGSHALRALNGRLQIISLVEAGSNTGSREHPITHAYIDFIQPSNLMEIWPSTAAIFADALLASKLQSGNFVIPNCVPTIWIGEDVPGDGWSANSSDEIFALDNKVLCDDRLRKSLAPNLAYSITKIPNTVERLITQFSVLHILPQIVTGGAETALLEIVKGTTPIIKHAIVCLGACEGPLPSELEAAGAKIFLRNASSQEEIISSISVSCANILHIHGLSYSPQWIPIHRRLADWKIVESEQVVNIGAGHFGPVDSVVCVSNAARDAHRKYEDAWRECAPRFDVVYNGVDPANYKERPSKSEARKALGLPESALIVGRVSALARNKCPNEALEALKQTYLICPNVLFVIVGDGEQRREIEAWIKKQELSKSVIFLGERRDISKILPAFDVFAYYTTKEAFGNVILEATAAGIPVVVTDVEGTNEALGDAPGTLVQLGDISGFSQATKKWLEKRDYKFAYSLPYNRTRSGMVDGYQQSYQSILRDNTNLGSELFVTILIPVFNPEINWFKETTASIALQTFKDWSLLIVNDGSTQSKRDEIALVIESDSLLKSKTTIIDLPKNLGVAGATNAGLRHSRTDLIALLGADDRMHPQRLARQVAKFRLNPELSVVGGSAQLIDDHGQRLKSQYTYPVRHEEIAAAMEKYCCLAAPAVMYRKQHVLNVNGYNPEFRTGEDYDLWTRMAEAGYKFANLPSTLIDYRIHAGSLSHSDPIGLSKNSGACQKRATQFLDVLRLGKAKKWELPHQ